MIETLVIHLSANQTNTFGSNGNRSSTPEVTIEIGPRFHAARSTEVTALRLLMPDTPIG